MAGSARGCYDLLVGDPAAPLEAPPSPSRFPLTFDQLGPLFLGSLTLLILSIVFAMLLAWSWMLKRLATRSPICPESPIHPLPAAHWGAGTIMLAVVLYLGTGFVVGTTHAALTGSRDADREANQAEAEAAPGKPKTDEASTEKKRPDPLTTILLTSVTSILFCLVAFPAFRWRSKIEPSDLGLFPDHWRLQIRYGVVAALLAAPATYAIQIAATRIWKANEHPVQEMMQERFTPLVALLALLLTVFLAPVVEETLFRGILQRWLTRLFGSGRLSVPPPLPPLAESAPGDHPPVEWTDEPLVLNLSDSAAGEPGAGMAIVATSIIFAALHGPQWPAPIALFVLSLVLGGVYQKTGSLLVPMVLHGVFNGFSTLLQIAHVAGQQIQP